MNSKAAQMESLIRQASELDQQHVTELNAREADLDELRLVTCILHETYVVVTAYMHASTELHKNKVYKRYILSATHCTCCSRP